MNNINNKGTTFVEIISATVILLFMFQMMFNLFIIQKKFGEDNYMSGEYRRQIHFAKNYLSRDFFESFSARKVESEKLEITSSSGEVITYYLGVDPYGKESWKGKSEKTLYRKKTGENAQPLTQYCDLFIVNESFEDNLHVIKTEFGGGNRKIFMEGYYYEN